MRVTQETSVECFPTPDSMLAVRQRMAMLNETIQEWRVHPTGALLLARRIERSGWTGSLPGISRLFGIPIVEDTNVRARRCKVVVRSEVTVLP